MPGRVIPVMEFSIASAIKAFYRRNLRWLAASAWAFGVSNLASESGAAARLDAAGLQSGEGQKRGGIVWSTNSPAARPRR